MSETPRGSNEKLPRILELLPSTARPSESIFYIDAGTKGMDGARGPDAVRGVDVMATLRYVTVDPSNVRDKVDGLLTAAIDRQEVPLKGLAIKVAEPIGYVSDQLSVETVLRFTGETNYPEIKDVLGRIYGDDAERAEERLVVALVDRGFCDGFEILVDNNEFENAGPDRIADEMLKLTEKYDGL